MGDILDQETCNTTLGLGISLDDFVPKRDIQQKNHSKKPPVIFFDQLSFPFHFKDEQEIMEIGSSHKTEGSITSVSNNNGGSAGTGVSKKLRLTKEQSTLLEDSFKQHSAPNVGQKQALAEKLNLRPRQVEVWFQNRRARTKLKQTEVDCEFLKKCCENLSNENRRLKKEVQDLRSSSKSLFLQLQKANTENRYSVCSSCQKIIRFKGGNGGAGAGAGAVIGGDHNIVKVEPRTLMAAATAHAELGLYQAEPKKNPLINNVLR